MIKAKEVFKTLFNNIKNANKKILHTVRNGILFSSFICLAGIILLIIHNYLFISFDLIEVAMILFKTSIFFAMQFIICGIAFDIILKMQK